MKSCSHCGKTNPNIGIFCNKCGKPFGTSITTAYLPAPPEITTVQKESFKFKAFLERIYIYLYPTFLILIEYVLKLGFHLNIDDFIGPTLAASAVGMILPHTIYQKSCAEKYLTTEFLDTIKRYPSKVRAETDNYAFTLNICRFALLVETALWSLALFISLQKYTLYISLGPLQIYIGIVCYAIGSVLTEMKEQIYG